ncbi:MAG: C4-type zinc ribbon domain-containing protein [Bacteroidota bacterium]
MQQTIHSLIQLQKIDSAKDAIAHQKGNLPKQIHELETEVEELKQKIEKCESTIATQKQLIDQQKEKRKEATDFIAKNKQESATDHMTNYEVLSRELDLQELEIKLAKKKIKSAQEIITTQNEKIAECKKLIEEAKEQTQTYKKALSEIDAETEEEKSRLDTARIAILERIEDADLIERYKILREKFSLVVAHIEESACSGCFIIIPAQKQIKIREGKKVFACESCGRMLANIEEAQEEAETN